MNEAAVLQDFIASELSQVSSCTTYNACENANSCNFAGDTFDRARVFGLPSPSDWPCVGVYQSDLSPQTTHATLGSLLPQNLLVILLVSSLADVTKLIDRYPSYYHRLHILHTIPGFEARTGESQALLDASLLAGYAAYSLRCGSFLALENSMTANHSLADAMRSHTHRVRTNLEEMSPPENLSPAMKKQLANVKMEYPLVRVSLLAGNHLLVIKLSPSRNYVAKFAQTLANFRHNVSLLHVMSQFSRINSPEGLLVELPPLVTSPIARNATPFDLHADMALSKPEGNFKLEFVAVSTTVPADGPYHIQYVDEPLGFFRSQKIYPEDSLYFLLSGKPPVKSLHVFTGTPNQPDMKLLSGDLMISTSGVYNSKTAKVTCSKTSKVGAFVDGEARVDGLARFNQIACVGIVVRSYQPRGFVLHSIVAN